MHISTVYSYLSTKEDKQKPCAWWEPNLPPCNTLCSVAGIIVTLITEKPQIKKAVSFVFFAIIKWLKLVDELGAAEEVVYLQQNTVDNRLKKNMIKTAKIEQFV